MNNISKPLSGAAKISHDKKLQKQQPIEVECFCCWTVNKVPQQGKVMCKDCGTDLTFHRDVKLKKSV